MAPVYGFTEDISVSLYPTLVESTDSPTGDSAIASVPYTGKAKLFDETLETPQCSFVICHGVTARAFADIEHERDRRRRHFRFHYRPDEKTLYISVPLGPHEQATHEFAWYISRTARRWFGNSGSGACRFDSDDPRVPGSKEADDSFVPKPPRGVGGWPTLIIETGYSEPMSQLLRDMHWWFGASQHQVKIVILIKLDRDTRRMRVLKYTEDWPPPPGTTRTRPGTTLTNPILRHENIIQPVGNSQTEYQVFRDDLVLEFELLFLRAPDLAAGERDVVISVEDLKFIAQVTWG